jgi:hypothetical protein
MSEKIIDLIIENMQMQGEMQQPAPQGAPQQGGQQQPQQIATDFLKAVGQASLEDLNALRYKCLELGRGLAAKIIMARMISILEQDMQAVDQHIKGGGQPPQQQQAGAQQPAEAPPAQQPQQPM